MTKLLTFLSLITLNIALADNHKGHHHATSLGAHEHGSIKLDLAVEGPALEIELEGPAESFIGFEYAPKTDKEKKVLFDAEALWTKNLLSLFTFDKTLACSTSETSFKQEIEDHKGHKKASGIHSEIRAKAKITCNADLKGKSVEISLKRAFPKIKNLKADLVGSETKTIQLKKASESIKL
jgi:hypothetical protein